MAHILFISHARGIHGAEAVMVRAIHACAAAGARTTVVVPSLVEDAGLNQALCTIPGVQVLALPYRAAGEGMLRTKLVKWYNMFACAQLKRLVVREQVTAIYSNTSITILGAELAKRTGIRHVWHWHEPVDKRYGWHFTMRNYYRSLAKATDTIVCISQQQLAEWKQTLDMPLPQAQIIYNPIKAISVPALRNTSNREIRIGFIGHFEERKNLPLLVQTFVRVHNQVPSTTLHLCGAMNRGDDEYIGQMTDLREPVLTVLPQTKDVEKFYSNIDILVLPSWRETMPLVVLEAMQAGVCVLQTNRSGMSELLEDGKETLFFSPDKPEELEQLLMNCMDAEYRLSIAQAGQEKALYLVKNQQFDKQIQTLLCEL